MLNPLLLQADSESRFPLCLHSAASTNLIDARFSFLPDRPELALYQDASGRTWQNGRERNSFDSCLDALVAERSVNRTAQQPPFVGGWVVYYGFESYLNWRALSPEPKAGDSAGLPRACLWRVDRLFVHDRRCDRLSYFRDGRIQQKLPIDENRLRAPTGIQREPPRLVKYWEEDENIFLGGCARIIEAITRGDVIQVNLARPWELEFDRTVDAGALALALAQWNPSPFFCRFPLGDHTVISASPERLFCTEAGRIQTRPLGGTVPRRHDDAGQDRVCRQRLLNDPKLRSEHIMLVDLERSDISRICEPRSVHAPVLMQAEAHPGLYHLMSVIEGRLREDIRPSEIFRAMCPGGSISGCPKKICLQIIRDQEKTPRQWYTGAFGYIDDSGATDINLLIRSLSVCEQKIYFRMGAGVVADSAPEQELDETRLKARGLLRAVNAFTRANERTGPGELR